MHEAGTKYEKPHGAAEREHNPDNQGASGDPVGPEQPVPWRGRAFSSLRHRNYRLYFFGQMISQSGSWVQIRA